MKYLTTMLFVAAVGFAGGCSKKEDKAASGEPAAPAPTAAAPEAADPAPAAAADGSSEACKLLTGAKLSELSGLEFGDAKPAAVQDETSACYWENEGGGSLSITFYKGNTGKEAWKNMSAAGANDEPLADVGDEAFVSGAAGTLRVRKGDNAALLDWRVEVTPEQQKAIANEVAANM